MNLFYVQDKQVDNKNRDPYLTAIHLICLGQYDALKEFGPAVGNCCRAPRGAAGHRNLLPGPA
jgi:hypothetical protein